jgi:type II secretory pathway pseudopilin PulG
MHSRLPRGSALLLVLIVMTILAVLAVLGIQFTGREREAAHAFTQEQEVRACAETARANLLSRLRTVGIRPTEIRFSEQLPDSPVASTRSTYGTGHLATSAAATDGGAAVTVEPVQVVLRGVGSTGRQARDVTNLVGPAVLGGQYYRIAVQCQSRGGRQHEMEMLVRFGI